MAEQIPPHGPENFWQSLGLLIGGGGFSAVVLEIIRRFADRQRTKEVHTAKASEQYIENLRKDNRQLIEDYRLLQERFRLIEEASRVREDALEERGKQLNLAIITQMRATVELETENKLLRTRHVRMKAYCAFMVHEVSKRLSLPESEVGLPRWIDETVDGPTDSVLQIVPLNDPPHPELRYRDDTD